VDATEVILDFWLYRINAGVGVQLSPSAFSDTAASALGLEPRPEDLEPIANGHKELEWRIMEKNRFRAS
jgi:hypothetical protein